MIVFSLSGAALRARKAVVQQSIQTQRQELALLADELQSAMLSGRNLIWRYAWRALGVGGVAALMALRRYSFVSAIQQILLWRTLSRKAATWLATRRMTL